MNGREQAAAFYQAEMAMLRGDARLALERFLPLVETPGLFETDLQWSSILSLFSKILALTPNPDLTRLAERASREHKSPTTLIEFAKALEQYELTSFAQKVRQRAAQF